MRTIFVLAAALASGCAAPMPTAELLGSNDTSRRDTDVSDDQDASTDKVQPVVVEEGNRSPGTPVPASSNGVWKGRVETTSAVDFGGGIYCDYRVVLSNIDVRLTLDERGRVTSSRIQSTMTEATTRDCQAPPLGTQQNLYTFDASKTVPAGLLEASLVPDARNLPLANVALTADLVDAQHMSARLVVQRTGGTAPSLDWTVTTTVQLTKQ